MKAVVLGKSFLIIFLAGKNITHQFPGKKGEQKDFWLGVRFYDADPGWQVYLLIYIYLALLKNKFCIKSAQRMQLALENCFISFCVENCLSPNFKPISLKNAFCTKSAQRIQERQFFPSALGDHSYRNQFCIRTK